MTRTYPEAFGRRVGAACDALTAPIPLDDADETATIREDAARDLQRYRAARAERCHALCDALAERWNMSKLDSDVVVAELARIAKEGRR